MDLLDRLLGHDSWTTRHLLERSRELSDEQLDRVFDIGHGALRSTLVHMVGNVEVWTDLMHGRPVRPETKARAYAEPVEELLERYERAAAGFAAFARSIADAHRLDDLWEDYLDEPPSMKSYGGAILHVLTHNMHHRGEVLHMLQRLGVADLIEGDLLSWEQRIRGIGT